MPRATTSAPPSTAEPIQIAVADSSPVSGLWQGTTEQRPERDRNAVEGIPRSASGATWDAGPKACFVMAHGAGAGMRHAFLESVTSQLAALGIESLRYQFPYMDRGSRRPDPPKTCHATVRAAVAAAAQRTQAPLVAGGRSFGGRMTSQAQAEEPLPGVRGLVFLAFPLHPAQRPTDERGRHLFDVRVPMLFLQGTRDELAEMELLEPLAAKLGARVTLKLFDAADHSFHVPARSGRSDAEVLSEICRAIAGWVERL